jgi:hypothetical protein
VAHGVFASSLLITLFFSSRAVGLFDTPEQRDNRVLEEIRSLNPANESTRPPPEVTVISFNGRPSQSALESYLATVYNEQLGLYREAPTVAQDTHWLYSDAYLAGVDLSGWNVPPLRRWTVLLGETVPEEVFAFGNTVLDLGNGVKTEVEDESVVLSDWMEYADRLLLAAINARNAKNAERERELMTMARQMWDGRGLRDKVFQVHGRYETYKTALYYYMTKSSGVEEVLAKMQEKDRSANRYGGMFTEYGPDGKRFEHTDTNTETSAITLIALKASS